MSTEDTKSRRFLPISEGVTVHQRFTGWLLWRANLNPPQIFRHEFYALKDHLLRRYGSFSTYELQEITKDCWDGPCSRCRDGIYDQFWVTHEKWRLGNHFFHRPVGRQWKRPEGPIAIRGYINHRGGKGGKEAGLWLALLFDRRLFGKLIWAAGHSVHPAAWPMLRLQKVLSLLHSLITRLTPRPCSFCGRTFRPLRDPGHWMISRQCRNKEQDIPF